MHEPFFPSTEVDLGTFEQTSLQLTLFMVVQIGCPFYILYYFPRLSGLPFYEFPLYLSIITFKSQITSSMDGRSSALTLSIFYSKTRKTEYLSSFSYKLLISSLLILAFNAYLFLPVINGSLCRIQYKSVPKAQISPDISYLISLSISYGHDCTVGMNSYFIVLLMSIIYERGSHNFQMQVFPSINKSTFATFTFLCGFPHL